MADASDAAIEAVLQQEVDGHWHPISYFSKKLRTPKTHYGTFDCELLVVYLSIKHFQYFVEDQEFHVIADHKPLTFALSKASNKYSPRQIRHLDYITH